MGMGRRRMGVRGGEGGEEDDGHEDEGVDAGILNGLWERPGDNL